jgi:serine protease Do
MKLSRITLSLALVISLVATTTPASSNLDLARQLNAAFVEVAEKVSPAVVVITVTQKPGDESLDSTETDDEGLTPREFWKRFHERFEDTPMEKLIGQGSGVIIRENGYILSNRHVVEDAEKIEVRLKDGRKFKATVRGVDPQSDVAVIKIEAKGLPVAKLADSSKVRVGEFAIAIGAPFSLDYSVTFGHVSAKGRSNIVPAFAGGSMLDQDFIQTDANINPGNSGGPLVNIDGEVIGINTLIRGLRTGIGFAIPSDLAREVSDQLITDGKFTRAMLGVRIHALNEDPDFEELAKNVDAGVVVYSIMPDGPAAKSELKSGDIIRSVDGHRVTNAQELRNEVRGKKIGQPVALEIVRKGKPLKIAVKPGEYVDPLETIAAIQKKASEPIAVRLGLKVEWLTQELADKFTAKLTDGVIVTSVEKSSLAEKHKIKPGDVITAVNDERTASPAQFREALRGADLKKGVALKVVSGESTHTETVKEPE